MPLLIIGAIATLIPAITAGVVRIIEAVKRPPQQREP